MLMYNWHSQLDLGGGVTIPSSDYFKFRRTNANRYINDLLRYFFPVEVLASSSLTGGECFANKDKGPSNKNQLDPCIIRVITRKDVINPTPLMFFHFLFCSCLTLCFHIFLANCHPRYSCIFCIVPYLVDDIWWVVLLETVEYEWMKEKKLCIVCLAESKKVLQMEVD